MNVYQPTLIVDARGLTCPMPIVRTANFSMSPSDSLGPSLDRPCSWTPSYSAQSSPHPPPHSFSFTVTLAGTSIEKLYFLAS